MPHGIPAALHRDVPWLHRHNENGALTFVLGAQRDGSFENPQHMFWLRNKKINLFNELRKR